MWSFLEEKSFRQKFSHARPAAHTRFRSETGPLVMAPIAAFESIRMVIGNSGGQALTTMAAAANSAIKLLPSVRTTKPPDQMSVLASSVTWILAPELDFVDLAEVDPS